MKIVVVCPPPDHDADRRGEPMRRSAMTLFARCAKEAGFEKDDFEFVPLCGPIDERDLGSESRVWSYVEPCEQRVRRAIEAARPDCVVVLGKLAARAVLGHGVQIEKARGDLRTVGVEIDDEEGGSHRLEGVPVYVMYDPYFPVCRPEKQPTLRADFRTLKRLSDSRWIASGGGFEANYQWVSDLQFLLDLRPAITAFDTEAYSKREGGSALDWQDPDTACLCVQLCWTPGVAVAVPTDKALWERVFPGLGKEHRVKVWRQLKAFLEDADLKKCAQNGKFDLHILRESLHIEVKGFVHDTIMLSHALYPDLERRNLDDLTRMDCEPMANYADQFNRECAAWGGKGRMELAPPDQLVYYGCGDVDATLRLTRTYAQRLMQNGPSWQVYRMISMPGILAFAEMEKRGILIDKDRLRALAVEVATDAAALRKWLLDRVPGPLKLRHLDEAYARKAATVKTDAAKERHRDAIYGPGAAKVVSLSRSDFVRDVLFAADGLGLDPQVYTKSTEMLDDDDRLGSISAKHHLPYFFGHKVHGEFVRKLAEYSKLTKLLSTYLGEEVCTNPDSPHHGAPTGIWKYIGADGKIHPSFLLWVTNTGRSNSRNPNGQNFPSRGKLAKMYLKIFKAPPGYKVVAADLSQIELRVVAVMANDREMLRVYRSGGDIHTYTAKKVGKISDAAWDRLPKDDFTDADGVKRDGRKTLRTKAKCCNFGFVFGMSWRKFQTFAFTDYGVVYSDDEAKEARRVFFATFADLLPWHDATRKQAHLDKGMYALHGSWRALDSIDSSDEARQRESERQAINAPVQRFGSDLGVAALSMLVAQRQDWLYPICFIHDALYFLVEEGREKEGVEAIVYAMQNVPLKKWFGLDFGIPILAEPDVGISFGDKVELGDVRGKTLAEVADAPEWFRDLEESQGILSYAQDPARPAWWRTDLEDVGVDRFWKVAA